MVVVGFFVLQERGRPSRSSDVKGISTPAPRTITWYMKGVDLGVSLKEMRDMRKAGITVLTTEWGMDEEVARARAFLDRAQAAGLGVVMDGGFTEAAWGYDYDRGFSKTQQPVWQEALVKEWVSTFKDHPALYGWDIASEDGENFPNGGGSPLWPEKSSLTIRQLKKASATVRAADPKHPILLRMHYWDPSPNPFGPGNWFADGIADIVMLNFYSNYAEDGKTPNLPDMVSEEGLRHLAAVRRVDPDAKVWLAVAAFEAETHVGYFRKPKVVDLRRDLRASRALAGVSGIGVLEWGPQQHAKPYWYLPRDGRDLWRALQEEIAAPAVPLVLPATVSRPRLDLGIVGGGVKEVKVRALVNDGIRRIQKYWYWSELESEDGVYDFEWLDEAYQEVRAAGAKLTVIIEVASVDCTDETMTDAECLKTQLPADVPFSRRTSRWDDAVIVRRLSHLVRAIAQRTDPAVLTHIFVGNETDSYLEVVREGDDIDLFPSFQRLLKKIQREVNRLHAPRPKFGTIFKCPGPPTCGEHARTIVPVIDVMSFTLYPTDPDWGDESPLADRVPAWLAAARAGAGGRPVAITEIGASAVASGPGIKPTLPVGSPGHQREFAELVIKYLKANPTAFPFVTWFSLYGYPADSPNIFVGMGLMTLKDVKRPAYEIWAKQGTR